MEAGALAWADAGSPVEIAAALQTAASAANEVCYLVLEDVLFLNQLLCISNFMGP